jgi:glycerophosphoryl diester phosphodiesterase
MRLKQRECEVWFLSGCGLYPHVDDRRTSFAAACAFAQGNGLEGVVLPASVRGTSLLEPLKHEPYWLNFSTRSRMQVLLSRPEMAAEAAALQLRLMTYGLENNDRAGQQKQRDLGVSGVIVDDVQGALSGAA